MYPDIGCIQVCFFQWWFVLLAICFSLQISCVEYWACINIKSIVGVTPIGPSCLPKVMRGLVNSSHVLRIFWYSVPSSCLLIMFMQPLGARPMHFWCFIDILLWGAMPIHGQSLCLWICLARLSLVLSGMIYEFLWVSLPLNLIFCFLFNWVDMVTRYLLDYIYNLSLVLVMKE